MTTAHKALQGLLQPALAATTAVLKLAASAVDRLLTPLALLAIKGYQRWLSPFKGFVCAYRVHTGRASCSVLGFRAMRWHGVFGGWVLLQQRTERCGVAHRRFGHNGFARARVAQRGDCDLGCADCGGDGGICDLPSGRGMSSLCQFADCCDAGDCSRKKRRNPRDSESDKQVHIPRRWPG